MSQNLKTQEVIDAVVARLAGASLSFSPKLIQDGGLDWYVQREDLVEDLPAVFVLDADVALDVTGTSENDYAAIGGQLVEAAQVLRVLTVFAWTDTDNVPRRKRSIGQEVAEVFIGPAGYGYDLGGGVAPLLQVLPRSIEFIPVEGTQFQGQVTAVAVELLVRYRNVRV